MSSTDQAKQGFTIFRGSDAPGLMQAGCMTVEPFTPVQREGMNKMVQSGMLKGEEVKVLCNIPGFSLTHVWFKKDYPLPLHSHDTDCLYYIIAGSLKIGTEELGPKDSFFLPADVPYTYRPGENGVELLEFRHETHFNFVNLAKGEAFWKKGAETVMSHQQEWESAERPTMKV